MAIDPKKMYKEGTSLLDAKGAISALLADNKERKRKGRVVLGVTLLNNILTDSNYMDAIDTLGDFEDDGVAEKDYLSNRFTERAKYIDEISQKGGTAEIKNGQLVVNNKDAIKDWFVASSFQEDNISSTAMNIPTGRKKSKEYREWLAQRGEIRYNNFINKEGKYDWTKETLSEAVGPINTLMREGGRDIMHGSNISPIVKGVKNVFGMNKRTGEEERNAIVGYTNQFRNRGYEVEEVVPFDGDKYEAPKLQDAQEASLYEMYYQDKVEIRKPKLKDNGKLDYYTNEKYTWSEFRTKIEEEMQFQGRNDPYAEQGPLYFSAVAKYIRNPSESLTEQQRTLVEARMKVITEDLGPAQRKLYEGSKTAKADYASWVAGERLKVQRDVLGMPLTEEEQSALNLDMFVRQHQSVMDEKSALDTQLEAIEKITDPDKKEKAEARYKTSQLRYESKRNNLYAKYQNFIGVDDPYYLWQPTFEKQINIFLDMNDAEFAESWQQPLEQLYTRINKERINANQEPITIPQFDRRSVAVINTVGILSHYLKNNITGSKATGYQESPFDLAVMETWIRNKDLYDMGLEWTGSQTRSLDYVPPSER